MQLDCACSLTCKCNCRLIQSISHLLDASKLISEKRDVLCDLIGDDCDVFDGALDDIAHAIITMLEIERDTEEADYILNLIFDYSFGLKEDKNEVINLILGN